ncbi:hypothetical protein ACEPAI_9824 [Sanghuangporus weigelae]
MTFYGQNKDSFVIHDFSSGFDFSPVYSGALEERRMLKRYNNAKIPDRQRRLNQLVRKIKAGTGKESSMYGTMAALLTSISLDLTRILTEQVLIFVPNSERRLASVHGSDDSKPGLVAFFAERKIAELVVSQAKYNIKIPPAQSIVCPVELKSKISCMRYMLKVSRNNPSSSIVYGIFVNRRLFQLFSVGLDHQAEWKEVEWEDEDCIHKLFTSIDLIRDNATRQTPLGIPKFISAHSFKVKNHEIFFYSTESNGRSFTLLPVSSGRGSGRKGFVAIAVPSDAEGGDPSIVRIFKYAWYQNIQHGRERNLLMKLRGVPGVVQIDETLSQDSIDVDQWSGRVRSLLALKTIGYPLCSCTTVLEFLEAMYDLLEVLRYLAQEKEVLHRDISWGNVLIRPEHAPDVFIDLPSPPTNEPIPHTYRFISDIFYEEKRRVRVVLTDFDFASDLKESSEEELKEATGTTMFMANDVLVPRESALYFEIPVAQFLHTAVMDSAMKYSDDSERAAWNAFYSHLREIEPIPAYPASDIFRHGAVHDAESVFYLCLLFFQPHATLEAKSTGRGERYEFHLHDFMQRLILKKIRELRQDGADPIAISDKPRKVRVRNQSGGAYSSHSMGLASILNKREQNQDIPRVLPSLMMESRAVQPIVRRTRSSIDRMRFKNSHLIFLMYKERERLWTTADKYS